MTLPDIKFDEPGSVHVVRIGKQRTSIRLDSEFWSAFEEIALSEGCSIHDLCVMIDQRRGAYGLTAAIRTFILCYYRSAMKSHRSVPEPIAAALQDAKPSVSQTEA